jgi:ferredoxin
MSINVEFAPDDLRGIVAEGTYLWDAAKRLGLRLPAECEGRGECDTCAVRVREGATLLSALTSAERVLLSPERLGAGERLACQARAERPGTLVLEPVPVAQRETETTEEVKREMREEFNQLPLKKKLTTLAELEAATAYQTFKAISDASIRLVEQGVGVIIGAGRARERRQRAARRPAEHRPEYNAEDGSK